MLGQSAMSIIETYSVQHGILIRLKVFNAHISISNQLTSLNNRQSAEAEHSLGFVCFPEMLN